MTFRIALLPGLDGTGDLFKFFHAALPETVATKIIKYPLDRFLEVDELARYVSSDVATFNPDVILAESFSGPVAIQLLDTLQQRPKLLLLCASFVTNPRPIALTFAQFLPLSQILRLKCPEKLLRLFCFDAHTSAETIALFQETIACVPAALLASRLKCIARLKPPTRKIAIPCVLIRPRSDLLVPDNAAENVRKYRETLEIVDFDGPHFLLQSRPLEAAQEVCSIVERHLKGR